VGQVYHLLNDNCWCTWPFPKEDLTTSSHVTTVNGLIGLLVYVAFSPRGGFDHNQLCVFRRNELVLDRVRSSAMVSR
jgi:hypothetical protein